MKLSELKNISGIKECFGTLSEEEIILTTDTRNISGENLFIALSGENFDGFKFFPKAIEAGIKTLVCSYAPERKEEIEKLIDKDTTVLLVEDSLKFLQDAASYWVRQWQEKHDGVVFSITGSNGKTTTKEILFELSKEIFGEKAICTKGNLNNHIGVPLTIFNIKKEHQFAIVEMGTNHPGEIKTLCEIANPHYGLITNIGAAHLEFLIDEQGVFKEKTSLFRHVEKFGKYYFVNTSDKHLANYDKSEKSIFLKSSMSIGNPYIKEEYNKVNLQNSLEALSYIYPDFKEKLKAKALEVKLPENNRSQWIKAGDVNIFLDAYNANPSSMASAIKSFVNNIDDISKAYFVIGDMNELGDKAQKYHNDISKLLNQLNVKNAAFIGRYSKYYLESFEGNGTSFESTKDFDAKWKEVLKSYSSIFLKASRTLQLESLVAKL